METTLTGSPIHSASPWPEMRGTLMADLWTPHPAPAGGLHSLPAHGLGHWPTALGRSGLTQTGLIQLLAFAQAFLRLSMVFFGAGVGPASLRTHYVRSSFLILYGWDQAVLPRLPHRQVSAQEVG